MKWREPSNDMCPFNIFINDISECTDIERILFHRVEDDLAEHVLPVRGYRGKRFRS